MADVRSVIGARVRITTSEGSYEGTVHSLDQRNRKLTLTKVVLCSSGKNLHGFHNFYGDELNDLEVIEQKVASSVKQKTASTVKDKERQGAQSIKESNAATERAPGHSFTQRSNTSQQQTTKGVTHSSEVHHEKLGLGRGRGLLDKALHDVVVSYRPGVTKPSTKGRVTRDASDEGPSLLPREPVAASQYLNNHFDDADEDDSLTRDDDIALRNPPQVIILDSFGNKFGNAVKFISNQRVIGIGCEGVNLDRFGKLCWIVVGCRQFIYLFDVVSLGASCFDEGLGDILRSADILKVFHDCRQPSDILFHQYGIQLRNVFDTQVADALIYRNETAGELPRYVNPLVACLFEYLNLPSDQCHFQKVRRKFMQSNSAIWEERPLPDRLLDATAKHVMYLRELRLAQMERMMAEFVLGVDIYLGVVRDAAPSKKPTKGQLLPPDFKKLDHFKVRRRRRAYDGEYADEVPSAGGSSNSEWNEGAQFAEQYQNKPGRVKERVHDEFDATLASLTMLNFQSASDSEGSVKETERDAFGGVARRNEGGFQQRHGANGVDLGRNQRVPYGMEQLPKPLPSDSERCNRNRSEYSTPSVVETKYYGRANGESAMHDDQSRGRNSPVPNIHPAMTINNSYPSRTQSNNLTIRSSGKPQAIFHQSDFPPLSSSDSECGTTPPRSSARFPSSKRESTGSPPMVAGHRGTKQPEVQPPNVFAGVEYSGPRGRGRARNLFNNMSQPPARLPAEDAPVDFRTLKMRGLKVDFPRDDELLAASEVVPVTNPHAVSGTRVRLRET